MIHTPELDHIVERQVALWGTKQRLSPEGEDATRRRDGPWVTVSMQLGSHGNELAQGLGQRLGWQVYDKQIVQAIAEKTHTRERILSRLDEHARGALQEYVDHLFIPDYPGRPAYLLEMISVLRTIARHGQAVLVGRGANWLLDPAGGLRVRVIAPFEKRVERLILAEGLAPAAAQRRLKDDDAERAAFIRQVFRREIDEPSGYDLVVNTGTLELHAAIETVLVALAHKPEATAEAATWKAPPPAPTL